ncbi:hypothetical protein GCM10011591_39300 [Nocardia camponoti]|uniref:Uncharacterized protein n=2 Tax=Nocardia camponoti TaxID=1616106 RepID=A0A917QR71_9NOCA|nr:hypothetical protein GCM10011591_39300 [Nocardia camponoti]
MDDGPSGRVTGEKLMGWLLGVVGLLLISLGIGTLTFSLIELNSWGWGSARLAGLLAIAVVALTTFFFSHRRRQKPMIPVGFLRNRNFTLSIMPGFFMKSGSDIESRDKSRAGQPFERES